MYVDLTKSLRQTNRVRSCPSCPSPVPYAHSPSLWEILKIKAIRGEGHLRSSWSGVLNNKAIHPTCPGLCLFICSILAAVIYQTFDAVICYLCGRSVTANPTCWISQACIIQLCKNRWTWTIPSFLSNPSTRKIHLDLALRALFRNDSAWKQLIYQMIFQFHLWPVIWNTDAQVSDSVPPPASSAAKGFCADLLAAAPSCEFAPSRQSVLSPECAVLSGVSRTKLWMLTEK